MEGNGFRIIFVVPSSIWLDRLMKIMKNLSQDSQSLDQDKNPESQTQSMNTNH